MGAGRERRGGRSTPAPLALAGLVVGLAAALPVAYLAKVVGDAPDVAWEAVWRGRTLELIARSTALAAAVAVGAVAVALPLAWLTVRTDLPGRRVWTVLVSLPLVVPSYVLAYVAVAGLGPRGALADLLGVQRLPEIYGFSGAWGVLVVATYPLVLLPARAALRGLDPSLEEAARSAGRTAWDVARTVVLPQLRPAVAAGGLLAGLYALHDFGAVSILRFDSFTRVIYQSYRASFDRTGAAALAALLVILMLAAIWVATRMSRGAYHRTGPGPPRRATHVRLGRWRWPVLGALSLWVALVVVLPVAVLVTWSARSVAGDPDWATVLEAARNSLLSAGLAAALAAVAALPVAALAARHPGRLARIVDAASHTGYALPGIVVALALVFVGIRATPWAYQTLGMAVFALVVLYLPLAVGAARAAWLQVPPSLEEAARGAGRGPLDTFFSVTAPLVRAGVLAGAALVFLSAMKELPAMILLAPTGFDTLAIEIWQGTNAGFFERGALPALVLLAISAPSLFLLAGREQ